MTYRLPVTGHIVISEPCQYLQNATCEITADETSQKVFYSLVKEWCTSFSPQKQCKCCKKNGLSESCDSAEPWKRSNHDNLRDRLTDLCEQYKMTERGHLDTDSEQKSQSEHVNVSEWHNLLNMEQTNRCDMRNSDKPFCQQTNTDQVHCDVAIAGTLSTETTNNHVSCKVIEHCRDRVNHCRDCVDHCRDRVDHCRDHVSDDCSPISKVLDSFVSRVDISSSSKPEGKESRTGNTSGSRSDPIKGVDNQGIQEYSNRYGFDIPAICLTGLHCCGDLSPAMLHYFTRLDSIQSLCFVSCCYHRMIEHSMIIALMPGYRYVIWNIC